jgi:hypothetical protein
MPYGFTINNPSSSIGGYPLYQQPDSSTQLQSTISAATSGVGDLPPDVKHHPITCGEELRFDEDGVFSCPHGAVPNDDKRTKACLIHSLAVLILEQGYHYSGMKELPFERYED